MIKKYHFSIIGTGNVASWLAYQIGRAGHQIDDIFGRDPAKATALAKSYHARPIWNIEELTPQSDFYFFSLSDDAYCEIIDRITFPIPFAIHTAGSLPISIFEKRAPRFGTIYPFQTISRQMDFEKTIIPLIIEGNSEESEKMLLKIAGFMSDMIYNMNGDDRRYLHLAAVFSCNFTNALYDIADTLLRERGIDPRILLPLWQNTLDKVKKISPKEAQTGPAIRGDQQTINRHLAMIQNPKWMEIYKLMTEIIQEKNS